jgi:hypothetical protein
MISAHLGLMLQGGGNLSTPAVLKYSCLLSYNLFFWVLRAGQSRRPPVMSKCEVPYSSRGEGRGICPLTATTQEATARHMLKTRHSPFLNLDTLHPCLHHRRYLRHAVVAPFTHYLKLRIYTNPPVSPPVLHRTFIQS